MATPDASPPTRPERRTSCDHLVSLAADLTRIPPPETPCNSCQNPSGNWLCLSCQVVLCSRYVNKHMLQHSQQTDHSVVLSLSTLSVWCNSCKAYLDAQVIQQLRPIYEIAYILKFGEAQVQTMQHPPHGGGHLLHHIEGSPDCIRGRQGLGNWMTIVDLLRHNDSVSDVMASSSVGQSRGMQNLRYQNRNCFCKRRANLGILEYGKNLGKLYATCATNKCNFFEWVYPENQGESQDCDGVSQSEIDLMQRVSKLELEYDAIGIDNLKDRVASLEEIVNGMKMIFKN